MESSDIEYMDTEEESSLPIFQGDEVFSSGFIADFGPTLAMLDMDVEEVLFEVQNSHEEVEGNKTFPCEFCGKVCKSKGGRTKHQRSKHIDELGESSTSSSVTNVVITLERTKSIIRDIGRYLTDEKLYKPEQTAEVFKLEPSKSFVKFLNDLLVKFKRKKSKDNFLKEIYGNTNAHWEEYFHLYLDKKIVFLMLIHLPVCLLTFAEKDTHGQSESEVICLTLYV
ncbi:uncharacterized protein LOC114533071 [Dendronephthya gigantea]|uniref:uncharacterized protein LOC114533071 n=1 Tax=Dendronephthya gigantea TaxID=151771 RepID=UPI0010691991|nr:uncharacterized protein LOC114533071 [Dendronephthya gigantea]